MQEKTHEEFIKEVNNIVGNEYTVLGKYKNSNTRIKIRHNCNLCNNYEYDYRPHSFTTMGQRCPECKKLKKQQKRKEDYQQKLDNIHGKGEYTIIGEFKENSEKVMVRHNSCGNEWEANIKNMTYSKKPTKCGDCFGTHHWTQEEFEQKLKERMLDGENYEVIGKYIDNSTNIAIKCKKCNQIFDWYCPRTLMNGQTKCPYCNPGIGTLNESVIKYRMKIQNLDNEYEYLGHYIKKDNDKNNGTYIKLRHKCDKCNNHEFDVYHNNFLVKHTTCPKCNEINNTFKLENLTKYYLDQNNIKYTTYKIFDECVYKRHLPFDFFIIYNDYLIETDGKQHFNGYNDDEESKEIQQTRDRIKDQYCLDNDLTLLRIAYTQENNIYQILDDLFNMKDLSKYEDILLIKEGKIKISNGLYKQLLEQNKD